MVPLSAGRRRSHRDRPSVPAHGLSALVGIWTKSPDPTARQCRRAKVAADSGPDNRRAAKWTSVYRDITSARTEEWCFGGPPRAAELDRPECGGRIGWRSPP